MKYQIMLKIMLTLLNKRTMTATEIANRYEISTRSVHRYVDELTCAGVPIDVTRGRYGGFHIPDTYRLPMGFMSKDEYTATINAIKGMMSQLQDTNLQTALEKLEAKVKQERIQQSVVGNIIVDSSAWGDSKKFTSKMEVCEQAVNDGLQLEIQYINRKGQKSKRRIDPYVLILKQNVWYIYAFCHTKQKYLTFKISRIQSATFTGRKFDKKAFTKKDIDLDFEYSTEDFVDVTMQIEPEALPDVEEWLGVEQIDNHGKHLIAEVSLPKTGLYDKILSFGGKVKVVSPQEIKQGLQDRALEVYLKFKEDLD